MGKETVDHPSHYNREGSMECIDEMLLLFGVEETKSFCKLNAWKYRYRAADKNGAEDLKKSDWYINKYKELCNPTTKTNITITPSPAPVEIPTYPLDEPGWTKIHPIYYKVPTAGDWPPGSQPTC